MHQRSWDHFIEARNILNTGTLGTVSHVIINQPGSYARAKEAEQPVPAGLDWDMWQGDAPKRAFKPSRLAFRGWYAYGSGRVGDWGAHHVDVGLWFMNADGKAPLVTMANSGFFTVPDADPEEVPDTFSISWKFDNFIMTFANAVESEAEGIEKWGVYFIGNRGWMQVKSVKAGSESCILWSDRSLANRGRPHADGRWSDVGSWRRGYRGWRTWRRRAGR